VDEAPKKMVLKEVELLKQFISLGTQWEARANKFLQPPVESKKSKGSELTMAELSAIVREGKAFCFCCAKRIKLKKLLKKKANSFPPIILLFSLHSSSDWTEQSFFETVS